MSFADAALHRESCVFLLAARIHVAEVVRLPSFARHGRNSHEFRYVGLQRSRAADSGHFVMTIVTSTPNEIIVINPPTTMPNQARPAPESSGSFLITFSA